MIFDFLYLPWRHQMRVDPVQDRELLGGLGFEKLLVLPASPSARRSSTVTEAKLRGDRRFAERPQVGRALHPHRLPRPADPMTVSRLSP